MSLQIESIELYRHTWRCDHAGCQRSFVTTGLSERLSLKKIIDYGWAERDGKHFCPEHAKEKDGGE